MKNIVIKKAIGALCILGVNTLYSCSGQPKPTPSPVVVTIPPLVDKAWDFETTPTWADEFDYAGAPNPKLWDYDIGGTGWGNNELQYYTNSTNNALVKDGKLSIIARKESLGGKDYTSTRLVSRQKGDFLYGRFEIKAKLPKGLGTWPAIWMLPTDWAYGGWPNSGEIDIMEHVGYDPNVVHISTHSLAYYFKINTQKTAVKTIPTAITDYHLYRVDWTPYAIRGYIDNEKIFEFVNENKSYAEWPFDKRFHILLNLAIGGDWGGAKGVDNSIFPCQMDIDYVRVYKMIDK
ncbi:glycoside hydrolase family 16 protein [Flectobacillus roseus]